MSFLLTFIKFCFRLSLKLKKTLSLIKIKPFSDLLNPFVLQSKSDIKYLMFKKNFFELKRESSYRKYFIKYKIKYCISNNIR